MNFAVILDSTSEKRLVALDEGVLEPKPIVIHIVYGINRSYLSFILTVLHLQIGVRDRHYNLHLI